MIIKNIKWDLLIKILLRMWFNNMAETLSEDIYVFALCDIVGPG